MIDKNNIENYVCDSCGNNEGCTLIDSYMGEVVMCEKCRYPDDYEKIIKSTRLYTDNK